MKNMVCAIGQNGGGCEVENLELHEGNIVSVTSQFKLFG